MGKKLKGNILIGEKIDGNQSGISPFCKFGSEGCSVLFIEFRSVKHLTECSLQTLDTSTNNNRLRFTF